MSKKANRQSLRSQKMLQTALIELLQQKPLHKISISGITDQADLARSTFYTHYETKEDLLESILDILLNPFFESLHTREISNSDVNEDLGINSRFFEVWLENEKVIGLLHSIDIDCLLIKKFQIYWKKYYSEKITPNFPNREPALGEYVIDYLAYSFTGILRRWISDDMKYPPEVVGRLLYQLTGPPVLDAIYENFNDFIK